MFYIAPNKSKKTRSVLSFIAWSFIPIFIGLFGVLFFTGSIDTVFAKIQIGLENIPEYLQEIQKKKEVNLFNREIPEKDYLAGIPIKEILRGQNKYTIDASAPLPETDALAFVVGDVLTGEIILEKNGNTPLPIASITKLMTASVALEKIDQTKLTRVSQKAATTESSRGLLRPNETIEVSDLLYPLLLVSSNDAAEVLAESIGRKQFIQAMNGQAAELGMENTSFDDPSGLSEHNISTAQDLFRLSEYLYNKHSSVFEITKLKEYTQGGRIWTNANRFAGTTNYEGGKTGYTSKAHRTGVALFSIPFEGYGDRVIGITLLKTNNRVEDYSTLLKFIEENVSYSISQPNTFLEQSDQEVTLSFIGDLMFDRGVKNSVLNNFNGDYGKLFENLKELESSDIAFANLEGPISDRGRNVGSKYSFRFEPIIAETLKKAGIDIVSFANNHVGDWSLQAFEDTLSHLQNAGILFTGAGKTKVEAEKVVIVESKGLKVGFLGFSDVGPDWMQATESQAGQLLANDPRRISIIEESKKKVDILVVSYHFGNEYVQANERQKMIARTSVDAGADIVVGHHPHVIQEIEQYKNGLIFYSLGNAIFDQHFSEETMEGMLASVVVSRDGLERYESKRFKINTKYQPQKPESFKKVNVNLCPKETTKENLILFNVSQKKPLPKNFIPDTLVHISETHIPTQGRKICLTKETLTALYAMYAEAQKSGISLIPTSGYRGIETQKQLFSEWKKNNFATKHLAVAPPEHSEHQLGTTIDFTSPEINYQSASSQFTQTKSFKWLSENAHKYGFVQSYPEGKESITGYIPESWHWRYVGVGHAQAVKNLDTTLVEYLETVQ